MKQSWLAGVALALSMAGCQRATPPKEVSSLVQLAEEVQKSAEMSTDDQPSLEVTSSTQAGNAEVAGNAAGSSANAAKPAESGLTPTDAEGDSEGESSAASPEAPPTTEASTAAPSSSENASGTSEEPTAEPFRFLLLTPGAPLIVDVHIRVKGRPISDIMSEAVELVLKAADVDGDGRSTWDEVLESRRFRFGQYGNLQIDTPVAKAQVRQHYDLDSDNVVDATEVPRFITRNAGGAQVFSLRGSNLYREKNKYDSPVRALLDADGDGRISHLEVADAAGRLRMRDADLDEILYPAELSDASDPTPSGLVQRRRYGGPNRGVTLDSLVNWDRLYYDLEEQYSHGAGLDKSAFSRQPAWFAVVDGNQDGKLQSDEVRALSEVAPDISLAMNLEAPAYEDGGNQELSIQGGLPPGAEVQVVGSTLNLIWPEFQLRFFVNDRAQGQSSDKEAQQLLAEFDADKNGYLGKEELESGPRPPPAPFDAYDDNADGRADADELAVHIKRQRLAFAGQVHARVADVPDAFFVALDANHDGRLDAREIHDIGTRLEKFDANGDEIVDLHEIPDAIVVAFARGNMAQGDALFESPPAIATASDSQAPRWFQFMDQNGDGVVSRREFLGTQDEFNTLDANRNEFVESGEVEQDKEE